MGFSSGPVTVTEVDSSSGPVTVTEVDSLDNRAMRKSASACSQSGSETRKLQTMSVGPTVTLQPLYALIRTDIMSGVSESQSKSQMSTTVLNTSRFG